MEYMPDDAGLTVEILEYLEDRPALLRAAGNLVNPTPADITRLRRDHPAEMVRGALVVAEARRKGKGKFAGFPGFDPEHLWGTPESVEQASGADVARHKAAKIQRYVTSTGAQEPVWDFCSGIGGDALALAEVQETLAVELSPVRAWCLERNLRATGRANIICGRLTPALDVLGSRSGRVFHIDPARRRAGRRTQAYEDLMPGPDVIAALLRRFPAGAVKLSPAVDFDSLPEGQLELISSQGTVVQAILWTGALAGPHRVATVFGSGGRSAVVAGKPAPVAPDAVPPKAFLYEVDGAVHRAQLAPSLAAELGLHPASVDGGYLTGEAIQHGALARFRHYATMAFAERKVLAALKNLAGGNGPVEVKTRGGLNLDTDALQRRLSANAPTGATVLIYRGPKGLVASICRRE